MRVPVHCCCNPGLLLGYMPLPDGTDLYPGYKHTFLRRALATPLPFPQGPPPTSPIETQTLTLTLATLYPSGRLAFKSDDHEPWYLGSFGMIEP